MKVNLYACISGLVVAALLVWGVATRVADSSKQRATATVPSLTLPSGSAAGVDTLESVGPTLARDPAPAAVAVEESSGDADPTMGGYDFTPASDLEAQVKYFVDRLQASLGVESDYDAAKKKRVMQDANTIAVLAMVLGKHDQQTAYARSAKAIIPAALYLAEHAEAFGAARAALKKLGKAFEATGAGGVQWGWEAERGEDAERGGGAEWGGGMKWSMVGDSAALMAQVPVLNTSLRRGVNGRRFERSREKSAGLAATLAAIAQVAMHDDTYCSDEAEQVKWKEFCVQMRDTAAACNMAIRQSDQKSAKDALKRMARSCEDCHEIFREEEE